MSPKHLKLPLTAVLLVGLPLFGLAVADVPLSPYLAFPPRPRPTPPPAFRWPVFAAYAVLIAAAVLPLAVGGVRAWWRYGCNPPPRARWPWWGTAAAAAGALCWILAWSRFEWYAAMQPHTFAPLWLAYIGTVNALAFRRTGRCLLTHRPGRLAVLFAISAGFWWFFEYLNRFVANWYYQGAEYGPVMYFVLATISFSTVLPAVLGTRDWLLSFDLFHRGWDHWPSPVPARPRLWAAAGLLTAGLGLAGIGLRPDLLFPLLWVAPLILIASIQELFGAPHLLARAARGRWGDVVAASAAALICGFFWEMWNAGSLVGWSYTVPYVQRFEIFAMPLLGYAGYLPFGMECVLAAELLTGDENRG